MSTAIRVHSLTLSGLGPKALPAMELHGKRQDQTSRNRRVREAPPLVHGTLDLRAAFDAHVEGCRTHRALSRPVLHAVVQYPTEIELTPEREQWMLDEAVAFVNATYGGRAVFAARLDRDEAGRHTVDVFATPIFRKETRRGSQDWVSTTKHGKELCHRHRAEIERRHGGKFLDGPRQVGIALQSAWREHLDAAARAVGLDLDLEPRREKAAGPSDRLPPEQFKAVQDALAAEAEAGKRMAELEEFTSELRDTSARLDDRQTELDQRAEDLAELASDLRESSDRLDRRREDLDRRETELRALWTAVEVVGIDLAYPALTPGKWRRGRRWKKALWDRVRSALSITWPDKLWTSLREWSAQVARDRAQIEAERTAAQTARTEAETRLGQARELGERLLAWVGGELADRLGLSTAEPTAILEALVDLERQPPPDDEGLPSP